MAVPPVAPDGTPAVIWMDFITGGGTYWADGSGRVLTDLMGQTGLGSGIVVDGTGLVLDGGFNGNYPAFTSLFLSTLQALVDDTGFTVVVGVSQQSGTGGNTLLEFKPSENFGNNYSFAIQLPFFGGDDHEWRTAGGSVPDVNIQIDNGFVVSNGSYVQSAHSFINSTGGVAISTNGQVPLRNDAGPPGTAGTIIAGDMMDQLAPSPSWAIGSVRFIAVFPLLDEYGQSLSQPTSDPADFPSPTLNTVGSAAGVAEVVGRPPNDYCPDLVTFDQTTYLKCDSITATDSLISSGSVILQIDPSNTNNQGIFQVDRTGDQEPYWALYWYGDADGYVSEVWMRNPSYLDTVPGAGVLPVGRPFHMLWSIDRAQGFGKIMVDGVDVTDSLPFSAGSGDFVWNGKTLEIGVLYSLGSTKFKGQMGELWIAPDQSLLDVTGNITAETVQKFYDGCPVDLGDDGSAPTGTAPAFYHTVAHGADPATFADNHGTGGVVYVADGALLPGDQPCECTVPPADDTDGMAFGSAAVSGVGGSIANTVGSAVGAATVASSSITQDYTAGHAVGRALVSGVSSAFYPMPDWVPPGNTAIQHTIGSYLYVQYNDDDDLQSLVAAYNAYTQGYLTWFNTIYLPIYTNGTITGALLDWVAEGLYGIARPGLPTQGTAAKGPFNTYALNTLAFNQQIPAVTQAYYATTDDTFKRIITWLFYKDDGRYFSIRWLKRRVARFLDGINGTSFNIDETYDISVAFTGPSEVTITVPDGSQAVILQAAIDAGVLELPFQFTWIVDLV